MVALVAKIVILKEIATLIAIEYQAENFISNITQLAKLICTREAK